MNYLKIDMAWHLHRYSPSESGSKTSQKYPPFFATFLEKGSIFKPFLALFSIYFLPCKSLGSRDLRRTHRVDAVLYKKKVCFFVKNLLYLCCSLRKGSGGFERNQTLPERTK